LLVASGFRQGQVEVTVIGQFGATHTGGPVKRIPSSETRQIDDPDLQFLAKPIALRPTLDNFTIDGKPLFDEFDAYIGHADALISKAKAISDQVHQANNITRPLSQVSIAP
jgi:hypothetical protein